MVFPPPFTRETLSSYGYRIARLSGTHSLPELARLFDLDLGAFLKGDPFSLERFATYVGHDPALLALGSVNAASAHHLQIGPSKRNKVRSSPGKYRFCPCCVERLDASDPASTCLGRTDWLVDALHICPVHHVRFASVVPPKPGRAQSDLSRLLPQIVAKMAEALSPADEPTALERYIIDRLDNTAAGRWIDDVRLDVVIHTAEVFGAMMGRGQHTDWADIGSEERRLHGDAGAKILLGGLPAITDFLTQHIGSGKRGDDYHHAFGRAFNQFYDRRTQASYQSVLAVLARYVGDNFRFTGQTTVFGIKTMGKRPTTFRSLCDQHGIGTKITAQLLEAQHGIRAGSATVVDPQLIEEIAPQLKEMLNARDAARHLGVGVDLLKSLCEDGLIAPDFRFNDRMLGFKPATLEAFKTEWCEGADPASTWHVGNATSVYVASGAYNVRVSQLLLATRRHGVNLYRDGPVRELKHMKIKNMELGILMRNVSKDLAN